MSSKLPPDVNSLDIDICDTCNFACIYCYHHDMNGHKMHEKTIETIVDAIPKTEKPFHVNFFGGEPLLALPQIKHFVTKCEEAELNIKFSLTSNLSQLNDEITAYMKSKNIGIHCSIDGNPAVQDTQRPKHGGQPTSQIIEAKVKYALDITPNDTVRMTILRKNIPHYFESVKYMFNTLGFASCAPVLVAEEDWTKEDFDLLEDQLKKTVDWVFNGLVRYKRWHNIKWIEKAKPASMRRGTQMCGAGMNNIAISLSGDMYPCHRFTRADSTGMYWLGNIHDRKWLVTFLQRRILVNGLHNNDFEMCLHCPAFESCGGGCPHINVTNTGNEELPDHQYLPPFNYCEIKRRQHHWGTYFWRKIYQTKVNNDRAKKQKVAPVTKPSQTGNTDTTITTYRDRIKGAEHYNSFFQEQKSAREKLIAKFGQRKKAKEEDPIKQAFPEEEAEGCGSCSC